MYKKRSLLPVSLTPYDVDVNALCSIEDVEGCLHEGGLIFLSEDSPKIISLRLPRSKTRERIKRLFPEFINLRAFHPHLGRDVFYRFRWAALYRGEFHYTSYVYNEFSNCYFHCNDSSCTRLDNFVGLRDACRPTYEIVNLEYVRVDPGKKSDAAIVLPKKLVYEALHLPGGFHESLKDPVKSTLEGLMGDYKPKEEKLPELEDLSIKVKPSPCQPTFLSERSNFEGPYALIPQKYFVIDDWPKLSLACLLLYNYPSLRVMMLGGGDWGMAYGEWETILTSVFTKLLLKEAFDDGSPAISLEDDETLDTKCKEKIAETSTQSVLQVFETLAANLRKDLVVDSLWMDYMKNGMKAEGRTLKLDCDKSASLLGCLENNAISFLNPPRHLTMILRNPKGLVFPEILSPGRSIYHGKVAVAYELHSILMNNSHVLLKNHNSGCWHQCTEDICGDTTSLPATEEERQKVVMVMYSLVYPSEKAVVDNIMSEFS